MGFEVHEECGIAAVALLKPAATHAPQQLFNLLLQMQNRGQLSAGITTYNPKRLRLLETHRGLGLVKEAFSTANPPKHDHLMHRLSGNRGIGHVRYSTFGSDNALYAQPFERFHGRTWKWFSFAFNGNLANYWDLRAELEQKKYHFQLESDTEVMMHHLAFQNRGDTKPDVVDAFKGIAEKFDGAYNIVYQNADGELVASRDPNGIKPLSFGQNETLFAAASESVALESAALDAIENINPGELVRVTQDGTVEKKRFAPKTQKKVCMFEFVYFSQSMSNIDGRNVYESRYEMGRQLAKNEPLTFGADCVVVPVPDTAKPVADAYGFELGLPVLQGLVKNDYIGRTFIESADRDAKVLAKFALNKRLIEGKKVILVEDSIVRGTTTKAIVRILKTRGNAKEVHVRSACPPIIHPCFYGIDFSTTKELIAGRHRTNPESVGTGITEAEENAIQHEIGGDSLHYQSIEGLGKAIGFEDGAKSLCTACLDGKYPTPCGQKLLQIANDKHNTSPARTYQQRG